MGLGALHSYLSAPSSSLTGNLFKVVSPSDVTLIVFGSPLAVWHVKLFKVPLKHLAPHLKSAIYLRSFGFF